MNVVRHLISLLLRVVYQNYSDATVEALGRDGWVGANNDMVVWVG